MLTISSELGGYAITASDGRLGTVSDLLFDDASWLIRWLVVDTGKWLSGRKVLLPPSVLGLLDPKGKEFPVTLTMQQVQDCPEIDTERPVSRQLETNVYDYYGWSPYWGTGFGAREMGGAMAAAPSLGLRQREEQIAESGRNGDDPHLRSIEAVTGYHIKASDGEIGHVEDFLVEERDWSIRYLIVDTKNWWPGKKVLISPRSARAIDWMDKLVHLDVDLQTVKDSPAYDATTTVDGAYDEKFLTYYGIRWVAK
jgi:sporulation protein YlmC with PRC-barrel domain